MVTPVHAVLIAFLLTLVSATHASATDLSANGAGAARGDAIGAVEIVRPEEAEVFRLYRSVLGRSPDAEGFDYWAAARVEGLSLRSIADGFLNSSEYARRFGAGSDAEFLDRVYGNVLGRHGDADGTDYWLTELSDGLKRTELVLLFSESAEHRTRTGTGPPDHPRFTAVVNAVTSSDLASSWRSGCPVDPAELRAVAVDHVTFDGGHRRGVLVLNADVVDEVVAIFETLYNARYPIASIRPVDEFDADDDASMAANNTSAFNCRAITGGTSWSRHAYGRAIDINPVQNPYVAGQLVLPPTGADFVARDAYHPAMIRPGDVVATTFANAGWRWGGDFRSIRDYQHFDR